MFSELQKRAVGVHELWLIVSELISVDVNHIDELVATKVQCCIGTFGVIYCLYNVIALCPI